MAGGCQGPRIALLGIECSMHNGYCRRSPVRAFPLASRTCAEPEDATRGSRRGCTERAALCTLLLHSTLLLQLDDVMQLHDGLRGRYQCEMKKKRFFSFRSFSTFDKSSDQIRPSPLRDHMRFA